MLSLPLQADVITSIAGQAAASKTTHSPWSRLRLVDQGVIVMGMGEHGSYGSFIPPMAVRLEGNRGGFSRRRLVPPERLQSYLNIDGRSTTVPVGFSDWTGGE